MCNCIHIGTRLAYMACCTMYNNRWPHPNLPQMNHSPMDKHILSRLCSNTPWDIVLVLNMRYHPPHTPYHNSRLKC